MAEGDGDYEEDEIVVDLGMATLQSEQDTVLRDAAVAEAVRNARNGVAEEYNANVNSPPRNIRIRVHSW